MSNEDQQGIQDILGFTKGELPFRYLGVPLSTNRVSIVQCQALWDRMLGRIKSWTTKHLSYAGGATLSKKAILAWDKVCYPKVAGGLNILDMDVWNKAATGKLLWNICAKKDKLWVQCVHCYYRRNKNLLVDMPKKDS
ncbi:hypothetical protein P3S67_010667 [Capsicum chacoense]